MPSAVFLKFHQVDLELCTLFASIDSTDQLFYQRLRTRPVTNNRDSFGRVWRNYWVRAFLISYFFSNKHVGENALLLSMLDEPTGIPRVRRVQI